MRTTLDSYLAERSISDDGFAALIERDRSLVNKLRNGRARPSLDLAARIESVTEGAIPMSSWAQAA